MARLDHSQMIERLEAMGLRVRSLSVATEGDYDVADVDWNNKDVPHLNHVHRWAENITAVVDADLQVAVTRQKVLGISLPLVLVHYDSDRERQTHVFTVLFWTVVTDIRFVRLTATRTRVVTTYAVAGPRWAMRPFPAIVWLLRRNYRQLMKEDVPMRQQRGRLRARGYRFVGDPGPRDIRHSLDVSIDNVVPPAKGPAREVHRVPVDEIPTTGRAYVGERGHLGVQLTRRGQRVEVFPRLCLHEGADLDDAAYSSGRLTCPWHGRRVAPVAVLDVGEAPHRVMTTHLDICLDGGTVVVTERAEPR